MPMTPRQSFLSRGWCALAAIALCFAASAYAVETPNGSASIFNPANGNLAASIQLWLESENLKLADNQPVTTWPDHSGHHRNCVATSTSIVGGVGAPGRFVKQGVIHGHSAVHFDATTGFASTPQNPVPIEGDAEASFFLVFNLQPTDAPPAFGSILGFGDPTAPVDPGKPLAAVVIVDRTRDHALSLAGGWNHDASLGPGSFRPLYGRSLVLSVIRKRGPISATTRFYIDGEFAGQARP